MHWIAGVVGKIDHLECGVSKIDLAALFSLVLFWSLAFVMLKVSVATIPPASGAFGRILIAAILLWVVMLLMGEQLPKRPEHWLYFIILGIIANVLPFSLVSTVWKM